MSFWYGFDGEWSALSLKLRSAPEHKRSQERRRLLQAWMKRYLTDEVTRRREAGEELDVLRRRQLRARLAHDRAVADLFNRELAGGLRPADVAQARARLEAVNQPSGPSTRRQSPATAAERKPTPEKAERATADAKPARNHQTTRIDLESAGERRRGPQGRPVAAYVSQEGGRRVVTITKPVRKESAEAPPLRQADTVTEEVRRLRAKGEAQLAAGRLGAAANSFMKARDWLRAAEIFEQAGREGEARACRARTQGEAATKSRKVKLRAQRKRAQELSDTKGRPAGRGSSGLSLREIEIMMQSNGGRRTKRSTGPLRSKEYYRNADEAGLDRRGR